MKHCVLSFIVAIVVTRAGISQVRTDRPGSHVNYRYSSYWTTKEGFQSTVQLHNNLIRFPLTITPILYQADGSSTALAPITLNALSNTTLDVNAILMEKGLPPNAEGSMAFIYPGRIANAISAETLVIQNQHTLSYTIPSYEGPLPPASQYFAYWKPSDQAELYLALQNTSAKQMRVHPTIRIANQTLALDEQVLGAHQLKTIHLPDDLPIESQPLWSRSDVGGIDLHYDGDALNTSAWVEDDGLGFSTMLSFHTPAKVSGHNLFGTQIMLGEQPIKAVSEERLQVTSYLILRNVNDEPVNIVARFIDEVSETPVEVTLPVAPLTGQEVRKIDLSDLQYRGVIRSGLITGAIKIEYDGVSGGVMGRVISISKDRSLGFYTALESFAGSGGSGVYWTVDGPWNSLLTVTNFGSDTDTADLQLTYNGGTLHLPPILLKPLQSRTMNLKEIATAATAAKDDKAWPKGITWGGYKLSGKNLRSQFVVKEQVIDPERKLATPFYFIPWVIDACLSQDPVNVMMGSTAQFSVLIRSGVWGDPTIPCSSNPADDVATDVTATLDNPDIAGLSEDESGTWTITPTSAGATTITATTNGNYCTDVYCSDPGVLTATGTLNVCSGAVVQGMKYTNSFGTSTIDTAATFYVMRGTTLTFRTDGATCVAPTWSGSAGATGTAVSATVAFGTLSQSVSDYQTVTATGPDSSTLTVNVIVFDFDVVLTPDDNFDGRSLTDFGVGEIIHLSVTITPAITVDQAGGLAWSVVDGGGDLTDNGDGTGEYDVPDLPGALGLALQVKNGPSKGKQKKGGESEKAPTGAYQTLQPFANVCHKQGYFSIMHSNYTYLTPKDVSFTNLLIREADGGALVASGFLAQYAGGHHSTGGWWQVDNCHSDTGCQVQTGDRVGIDDHRTTGFGVGQWSFPIARQYKRTADGDDKAKQFTTLTHGLTSDATGAATSTKGGSLAVSKALNDASVLLFFNGNPGSACF